MPTRRKSLFRWGAVAVVLAVVAAAVVLGNRWWRDASRTDLERAVAMAPRDAEQLSWTDWSGVREELGTDDVDELLERGFEADLTQSTALGDSAAVLEDTFGFSPATVDWELFSQSEKGAVVMLHLPDSADFDAIAGILGEIGYAEPDSATGTWVGSDDLLVRAGGVTPELTYLRLDEERGLLMGSDTQAYLEDAAADARDESGPAGLDDVVAASGDPLTAAIYTGDHACAKLAMSQADPIDQEKAAALVRQAGKVNPVAGFAISVTSRGDVRVVMSFESEGQARANADTRAELARGPAPGEGGDFTDLFDLGKVTADGNVVTMELEPIEGSYTFSSLKDGPLLFATC